MRPPDRRGIASRAAGLLATVLLVTGCGLTATQKAAVSRFGDAAEILGGLTAEEFVTGRNDVIEMRTLGRELGDTSINSPDGLLTVERTEIRTRAAKTLARYGTVLKTLIGSNEKQDIQNATDGLLRNISAVEGVDIPAEQAGAISKAVATVGGLFIEHNRKKAVRKVVPAMHEPMLQMLDAMRNSFDDYDNTGVLRWGTAYMTSVTDLNDIDVNYGVGAEKQSRASALASKKQQRFDTARKEILESIDKVRNAHIDLKNVLVNDEFTIDYLQELMTEIDQLVETYEILAEQ